MAITLTDSNIVSRDVIFDFISASFAQRTVAWLLDQAILIGLLSPLAFFYFDLGNITPETLQIYSISIIQAWVVFNIFYFPILERWKGQTFGKMIMGIRVLNENGEKISFTNALLRRVGMVAIGLFGIIMIADSLAILKTSKNQRLFDVLASSLVMKDEYHRESVKFLKGESIVQDLREKGVIQNF